MCLLLRIFFFVLFLTVTLTAYSTVYSSRFFPFCHFSFYLFISSYTPIASVCCLVLFSFTQAVCFSLFLLSITFIHYILYSLGWL